MKTRQYIFYAVIFIIGMITGLIGIMDFFGTETVWSTAIKFRHFMSVCTFVSGFCTTLYALRKIDGK